MTQPHQTYEQARAAEELNALLAHLPYARPLLGSLVVPLRWAHKLELTLSGNAFFTGIAPLRGDFFELLWRLDPFFRTGDGRFPNLLSGVHPPSRLAGFRARVSLWRKCLALDVHAAEVVVRTWLAEQEQDRPQAGGGGTTSRHADTVNQYDSVVRHFTQGCGYSPEQCLQLGVAWSWQQLRADALASGDPKAANRFVRPSAHLLGQDLPTDEQQSVGQTPGDQQSATGFVSNITPFTATAL
jgi:hypothetical protein